MEKQWRSLEEYKGGEHRPESPVAGTDHRNAVLELLKKEGRGGAASRRDFLKFFGFSLGSAAVLSSCEKPVQKAIPYLIRPEEITPGKSSYYASTFFDGNEYASILVKNRDGRPIKIEGNPGSPVSRGGTSARIQASVLNLYDDARYRHPRHKKEEVSWEEADKRIREKLSAGGRIVLVTPTIISPSGKEVLRIFTRRYPEVEWIPYDEVSCQGIRLAHERIFGSALIPGLRFERAAYILSFGADFLGTWLMPVEFARDWASRREPGKGAHGMSRHVQVESALSMTGTNADERIPVSPAEAANMLAAIYNEIAARGGQAPVEAPPCTRAVDKIVADLLEHRGESLVISGSNDPAIQSLVAGINVMLDNYGKTLDLTRTIELKRGDDTRMHALLDALEGGEVDGLILAGVNPLYSLPGFEAMKKAGFSVALSTALNETAEAAEFLCPDHHYLEAWGDAMPVNGSYSLQQPCINPLFNTRAWQDSLLNWADAGESYADLLKRWWQENLAPSATETADWWVKTLQAGYYETDIPTAELSTPGSLPALKLEDRGNPLSLVLYTSVGLGDGSYANNPWLQELPDPVSKVCWDNYLAVAPGDAAELGLADEMLVSIGDMEIPVLIQPGQARGSMALALGYGRKKAGKVGEGLGVNAFPLIKNKNGVRICETTISVPRPLGRSYELARTQTHHSMEERPIVREASLEAWKKDPSAGNHFHLEAEAHHQTLYPDVKFDGFHWGLVVDLNKCTGCNNCVVSCIAENNIAVVGKQEVRNRRIMHWMRIDRYFGGEPDNPRVYHQPVMCQHCDNAPCENVCPVSATMHSNEGLNQVAYVRCIGTKYCINNCPYRVRRFNWYKFVKNDAFDFNQNSDLGRLVLNPDVTVRERGVVEKCTLCVQRIQEKKMEAKLEGRALEDGEVQPACVQSCPSGALVFGNMNDPASRVSLRKKDERNYHLLEQLHTLPSVGYLTKIRNTDLGDADGAGHGAHGDDHGHGKPSGHDKIVKDK